MLTLTHAESHIEAVYAECRFTDCRATHVTTKKLYKTGPGMLNGAALIEKGCSQSRKTLLF
jgi:hypothetical protein